MYLYSSLLYIFEPLAQYFWLGSLVKFSHTRLSKPVNVFWEDVKKTCQSYCPYLTITIAPVRQWKQKQLWKLHCTNKVCQCVTKATEWKDTLQAVSQQVNSQTHEG